MVIKTFWMFAFRLQKEVVSAKCVFAQRLTFLHTQPMCMLSVHCVYISNVQTCTQEKYSVPLHLCLGWRLGLQHGADCWTAGMNGCRHLLSLVSHMEKGANSIWAESCYKWRGHLHWKTDWTTDRQQTDTEGKTGQWQTHRKWIFTQVDVLGFLINKVSGIELNPTLPLPYL